MFAPTLRHRFCSLRPAATLFWACLAIAAPGILGVTSAQAQLDPPSQRLQIRRYHPGVPRYHPGMGEGPQATPICNSPQLSYFGGPVVSNIQVVPVFWNSDVNNLIKTNIFQFYDDVTITNWFDLLSEYSSVGGTNQSIGRGAGTSAGITITPIVCPAGQTTTCKLTDNQLQAEIARQIGLSVLPALQKDSAGNTNTYYAVYFPPYISLSVFGAESCVGGGFCAYHNTGTIGAGNDPLVYGAIMDTFSGGCSTGCGSNTTALQNTEDVSSHELAETVTDADIGLDTGFDYAYPAAWGDNNNNCGEIGDICDDGSAGSTVTVSGRSWVVQELWSNALNACVAVGLHPKYVFSNVPGTATAGTPFNFTVTAQDPSGNKGTDIAYNGTIHFTSSDTNGGVVLPANYTFKSTDQGTATFAATLQTAGPQTITATDTQNNAITANTPSITVSPGKQSQTITFTTNAPASAAYGTSFTVVATASSGLPVTFTSLIGACSNVGATYTMTSGTGPCAVIADQTGNGTYSPAPTVTQTTAATLANQTITFTTNAPASATYGTNFTVAAGASSGLPVAFTSSGACSNLGATYTMTSGTGPCSVIANQAGDTNYAVATTVTQTTAATKASQNITFTINAPASATYHTNFTVAAGASSGLPVAFTSSGACSNVGATYTMTSGTGTCSVIANQAGDSNYSLAPQVTQTTTATKAGQSISFTTNAPSSAPYQGNFTVAATATSGNAVVFTSSGACTNVGATYTMTAASGSCSVIANQAGDSNYNAAPQVTEFTTATKAVPTVTFTGAPLTAPYQSSFTVAATTNASTTAVITVSGGVCSIAGTTVTMTKGTGICTMTAQWAADSNYLAASATQTTIAQKLTPTLTWATPAPIMYGTLLSAIQLDATATYNNMPLPGSFVYTPKAGKVLNAGNQTLSVTFTPTQSAHYATATDSVTLVVNPQSTTTQITGTTPASPTIGNPVKVKVHVTAAHGTPTQTVEVNSTTGETCSASLAGGTGTCTLVFATSGPRKLTATYSGDNNDLGSTSAPFSLTVNP
jgi:hypothetical protein